MLHALTTKTKTKHIRKWLEMYMSVTFIMMILQVSAYVQIQMYRIVYIKYVQFFVNYTLIMLLLKDIF